jgi:hypothetical protein
MVLGLLLQNFRRGRGGSVSLLRFTATRSRQANRHEKKPNARAAWKKPWKAGNQTRADKWTMLGRQHGWLVELCLIYPKRRPP